MARDEPGENSDVDIAVRLTAGTARGLAYIGRIDDLKQRLAGMLGRRVDLIVEPTPLVPLREEIERDRLTAF